MTIDPVSPEELLERLGLDLPPPPAPVANYRSWTREGSFLFISGQVSTGPGGDLTGRLGATASFQDGVAAARLCALNLLSQMKAAVHNLSRIWCVLRVTGYVNVAPGFLQIPQVIDACSSLLIDVLGEAGQHAGAAIGVAELPRHCLVEADAIVKITN